MEKLCVRKVKEDKVMEESLSKLMDIKNAVNAKFYEREKEVEALLIALLVVSIYY